MAEGTFVTAVNCMDGRVQLPVIEWMKNKYHVDYVDSVTEAGPNKVVLEGAPDAVESVKARVRVSVEAHGSKVVAIIGHHGCAGNPVPREEKEEQIKQAVTAIRDWGFNAEVIGLYVNEKWEVETVTE